MIFDLQIVRHGKTDAVSQMLYCGFSDLPLNQAGVDEINQFIKDGYYEPAERYYSSGLKRAVETLLMIQPNISYLRIPELREYNFGDFELQKHDDLLSLASYQEWIADTTGSYVVPNGESLKTFHERVDIGFQLLFQDICEKNIQSAMLTCHGGVISRFITSNYDSTMNMYEAMPSHGRGYKLKGETDGSSIEILEIKKI